MWCGWRKENASGFPFLARLHSLKEKRELFPLNLKFVVGGHQPLLEVPGSLIEKVFQFKLTNFSAD